MKSKAKAVSLFLILSLLRPTLVYAETMTNEDYRLQMGNLNSISGNSEGSGYKVSITSGENAPGLFRGTNFTVKSGFQYVPRGGTFTFTVKNTVIDFGALTPTNPVKRTTDLIVSNRSADSYTVKASQDHPLMVPATGAVIPDTTCDSGSCTEVVSSKWSNVLTYGFGYRCDGSYCPQGFSNPDFFKQFANSLTKEKAQTVMQGSRGGSQKTTLTYKVNISSSQLAGKYTNKITYIAVPSF